MVKANLDSIKKLRQQTSAPVMDCKKGLEQSGGDLAKAKVWLKKKGLSKVAKKKGNQAAAGKIHAYLHTDARVGAMVKLACQTDFVARNQAFAKLAHELCLQIASMKPKNVKQLLSQEYIRDPKKTIKDLIDEAIAKFGENIKVEDFARLEVGRD